MYESFTAEMAENIVGFSRAYDVEPESRFADTTGAMAALEACLLETVKEIGITSECSRNTDLRCIYAGLSQLLRLLESAV